MAKYKYFESYKNVTNFDQYDVVDFSNGVRYINTNKTVQPAVKYSNSKEALPFIGVPAAPISGGVSFVSGWLFKTGSMFNINKDIIITEITVAEAYNGDGYPTSSDYTNEYTLQIYRDLGSSTSHNWQKIYMGMIPQPVKFTSIKDNKIVWDTHVMVPYNNQEYIVKPSDELFVGVCNGKNINTDDNFNPNILKNVFCDEMRFCVWARGAETTYPDVFGRARSLTVNYDWSPYRYVDDIVLDCTRHPAWMPIFKIKYIEA